jgi:DNA-binding NarL/FixJ family response regulator
MPRRRILLADDHAVVLDAFRTLLEPQYDVVGTVTDGQALVRAARDLAPDVILVDLMMPGLNGLDAIERIRQHLPRARIVVLTMSEDPDVASEAIRRGASGFVIKCAGASELFAAITEVLAGRTYVSEQVAAGPSGVFVSGALRNTPAGLTLRQREVLQLLAEGKSMKEAAHVLDVTPRTIAFHKYSMMEQLGLRTTAELVQHAVALGLVSHFRSVP